MNQTLSRIEKLKSQKQIESLFKTGKAIKAYPLMLVWSEIDCAEQVACKAGFSVSKKRFKSAVKRNRIKRLMREAYRRNKPALPVIRGVCYGFMFVYLSREEVTLADMDNRIIEIFKRFQTEVKKTRDI